VGKRVRRQLWDVRPRRKLGITRGTNELSAGTIFTASAAGMVAVAVQPQLLVDGFGIFWERAI
jgi:hypothetical protein